MNVSVLDVLTDDLWLALERHALAEYPDECCGMIHRSGRLRICRNAQDEFHSIDPDGFPRTAAIGFVFGFADQLFFVEALEGDDPICAVYHSHPDGRPSLSLADRKAMSFEGQPLYPGVAQVVISGAPDRQFAGAVFTWFGSDFKCVMRWPLSQIRPSAGDSRKASLGI